ALRILPVGRGVHPRRARGAGGARRGGGLRVPVDQRPLPSVERRAGPERVRVVGHRGALAGDDPAGDHRRHLPHHPHPPRGGRAGGRHQRGDAPGPLHPRRRHGGGAQRARARRRLAECRRPSRDARGGRGPDARALAGRVRQPPRAPLHRRHRAHLHPPRAAPAGLRLRLRAQGDRPRGPHRRRLRHHLARPRAPRPLPREVRRQADPGRGEGGVGADRGGGRRDRPPHLGQQRPARRAGAGPALAAALRAGLHAGHPGDGPRLGVVRLRRSGPRGGAGGVRRRRVRRRVRRQHGPALRRNHHRLRRRGAAGAARAGRGAL
ncbi:MAG: Dehydrogenase, partial [uncultured Nocardioides sp.]